MIYSVRVRLSVLCFALGKQQLSSLNVSRRKYETERENLNILFISKTVIKL